MSATVSGWPRAIVMQQKTQRRVQLEITEPTRDAVAARLARARLRSEDFLFPSRVHTSPHLTTRQYARIVDSWVHEIGLDFAAYGTHTMRRTKASLIYRRTKNLRAIQLLRGHTKLESTVRYLGMKSTTRSQWRNKRRCNPDSVGDSGTVADRPLPVVDRTRFFARKPPWGRLHISDHPSLLIRRQDWILVSP